MADDDVPALKRELERTKKQLKNSLKLNIALEKANQKLEQLHFDANAWQELIANGVDNILELIEQSKNFNKPPVKIAQPPTNVEMNEDVEDPEPPSEPVSLITSQNKRATVRSGSKKPESSLAVEKISKTRGGPRGRPETVAPKQSSKLQCNKCHKVFKFKSVLMGHRRSCGDKASKTSKTTAKLKLKPKPRLRSAKSTSKTIACVYEGCDYKSPFQCKLEEHVRCVHENIKAFVCDHEGCDNSFKSKQSLNDHVLNRHSDERPFECSECDKRFATKRIHRRHVRDSGHVQKT